VDKAFTGIITDPSQLQGHSRMPYLVQTDTRNGDVNGLADEVEAMAGDMSAITLKERVVGRGPIAGDDVDLVSSSQFLVNEVEIFNGIYIIPSHDPSDYGYTGYSSIRMSLDEKTLGVIWETESRRTNELGKALWMA